MTDDEPIMPVTQFEKFAWLDGLKEITVRTDYNPTSDGALALNLPFTPGKAYAVSTGAYKFTQYFHRQKIEFDEDWRQMVSVTHECSLLPAARRQIARGDLRDVLRGGLPEPSERSPASIVDQRTRAAVQGVQRGRSGATRSAVVLQYHTRDGALAPSAGEADITGRTHHGGWPGARLPDSVRRSPN